MKTEGLHVKKVSFGLLVEDFSIDQGLNREEKDLYVITFDL